MEGMKVLTVQEALDYATYALAVFLRCQRGFDEDERRRRWLERVQMLMLDYLSYLSPEEAHKRAEEARKEG